MDDYVTSNWRSLALQHIPEQAAVINHASSHIDLWQEFKELVALAATDTSKIDQLRPIFAYAWWCVSETGDSFLKTEVETYFYEDIPAYSDTEWSVPHFITASQFDVLKLVLCARLDEEESEALRSRFAAEPPPAP